MQHNSAVEKEHVTKKYVILHFLFDVCVKVLQWENLLGSSHLQNCGAGRTKLSSILEKKAMNGSQMEWVQDCIQWWP